MEHGDCFFFNDTATTEIYTLSLHDALPICCAGLRPRTARPTGPAHLPRTPCALHGVRQLPPCGGLWRRRTATLSAAGGDRKSTRLNSSHLVISYAVFCLKKKKRKHDAAVRV